jgi:hypothetical protein
MLSLKGINAYAQQPLKDLWWLLLITACVVVMFYVIFRSVVGKYSRHIASQPEPTTIWRTFPLRGWLLIVFMFLLGGVMKIIEPPTQFIASFYSGLGPMLILSSIRFLSNIKNEADS